jgi:hypothetical protein
MKTEESRFEAEVTESVRDLESIGRAWAAYGLRVGREALETSAETLRGTAALLGRIAARFDEAATVAPGAGPAAPDAPAAPAPDAPAAPAAPPEPATR